MDICNSALHKRAQLMQAVRTFFHNEGFLEVETPLLIPANAPEEHIDPVMVHPAGQLQTSPEICMKRLLCRGYKRIFQISRCWRASERGSRHLTEFTMLEWYRTDADYHQLMQDCENLLRFVTSNCTTDNRLHYGETAINPADEWQYITVKDAFNRFTGTSLKKALATDCFEELMDGQIEPALAKKPVPVILTDYPVEMATLARIKKDSPDFAERFELYIGGMELANGFSELADADEQRLRFKAANTVRTKRGATTMPLPEPFLAELHALPPSAGIALGFDRLAMLISGAKTIDEVVAFRPEDL